MAQGLRGGRVQPENVVAIPDWESHIASIAEKIVEVYICLAVLHYSASSSSPPCCVAAYGDIGLLFHFQKQHPATLASVRTMLYELLTNCIPSDVIMQVLLKYLLKKGDEGVQHELTHWAAFYEHRLHIGSKDIFHLEVI